MTIAVEVASKVFRAPFEVKDDATGSVQAAFSVFNVIDSDGDVVKPSAFTDGQEVPMVWSHRWESPIGKGVVKVGRKQAVFDGSFFLDTAAGMEAYKTVKNMGNLQEWSFGFRVLEAEDGEFEDRGVQFLKKLELFEVSPVLVGANRETRTLAIKGVAPVIDMAHLEGLLVNARTLVAYLESLGEKETPPESVTESADGKQSGDDSDALIDEALERAFEDCS